MLLASCIVVSVIIVLSSASQFTTSSVRVNGRRVTLYQDITYTGGNSLLGALPRSADTLKVCLQACMRYGTKKNPCRAVNFKHPNCWYLDSGIANDKTKKYARHGAESGYIHGFINPNKGEVVPASEPVSPVASDRESTTLDLNPCSAIVYSNTKYVPNEDFGKYVLRKETRSALNLKTCAIACRDYKGPIKCRAINFRQSECEFLSGSGCPHDSTRCKTDSEYTHAIIQC